MLKQTFLLHCFSDNNIFLNFPSTSSHLHPLQVENCDSNARLVVDVDDNGKFGLERANTSSPIYVCMTGYEQVQIFTVNPHSIPAF